jgi:hypothetical protein
MNLFPPSLFWGFISKKIGQFNRVPLGENIVYILLAALGTAGFRAPEPGGFFHAADALSFAVIGVESK